MQNFDGVMLDKKGSVVMVLCAGCKQQIERGKWESHALDCVADSNREARELKLWSEFTPVERGSEKRDFVRSWMEETGCTGAEAQLQWEQYLNQEGWTGRDERILQKRERQQK